MRKYIWLGLAVVLLGVFGALIWQAQSAGCPDYKGMKGKRISPIELSQWLDNNDNTLFEIQDQQLYVQEAIGSQGIILTSPNKVQGNFILTFDLQSLTQSARLKVLTRDENGEELYTFDLKLLPNEHIARIWKGKKLLSESKGHTIKPDTFYKIEVERIGRKLTLSVDGTEVLNAMDEAPNEEGRIVLKLRGLPDHPAAVDIKDMILYQSK